MEQQLSTSKVTVEYFDPHDVYKLLAPGLVPRLPLHNLHWQSHSGPLRSIDSLHIDLVQNETETTQSSAAASTSSLPLSRTTSDSRDDGFQTQNVTGQSTSIEAAADQVSTPKTPGPRRHQIPGLHHTPYLKVLLVRCDDNDSYKNTVRAEVREWIKTNTPSSSSSKKTKQENHDAYEWLVVHVVLPNTAAATQPRSSGKSEGGSTEKTTTTSRWRPGSTPLLEKFRSDFNSSTKGSTDRIAQIRIGINDLPYDLLPRVVPAVPSGYSESEQDAEKAWADLMNKFKTQILSSFDQRVTQYEEDIKEKDTQRALPGWNFCTFFILKEGLARGFENVGLVEDALVGYDELSVGLDMVLNEQAQTGEPESHGGAMLSYTEDLQQVVIKALNEASGGHLSSEEEPVDLQSKPVTNSGFDEITISSIKKAYRDMILANKVSVFDFRCYIFSRQMNLLLRLANASFTRDQLLSRIKEQQESILHGVAPMAKATPQKEDETENLSVLADVCRRALEFIPLLADVMRRDIVTGLSNSELVVFEQDTIDNVISSFAFSVAQQILAQTTTAALPIPSSTLPPPGGQEPKSSIPEPKTMMHPARNSSISPIAPTAAPSFPGPGRIVNPEDKTVAFGQAGVEELAAGRAELYMISRNILRNMGKKHGWSNGWDDAPLVGDSGIEEMENISLDDDDNADDTATVKGGITGQQQRQQQSEEPSVAGINSRLLSSAMESSEDFYRLYEILTDKAMRHYSVAGQMHAVQTSRADLAVLKFHLNEFKAATEYFDLTTPFFGERSWSILELSMLIMYAQCVGKSQSKDEYVKVAIKLLVMTCAANKAHQDAKRRGQASLKHDLDMTPILGITEKLFLLSDAITRELSVPVVSLFNPVELTGTPIYSEDQDTCSVKVEMYSLMPDEVTVNSAYLQASCRDETPVKELVLKASGPIVLKPGKNNVILSCNSAIAGTYRVDHFSLKLGKIVFNFDRDLTSLSSSIFKYPEFTIYQRAGAFDIVLAASKHTSFGKNNSLDIQIHSGWNNIKSCEVRIKPGTGGMRMLTTEAKIVDPPTMVMAKPPEAGLFQFNAISSETIVTLQFPYSIELDLGDVFVRIEATYITDSNQTFHFAKACTVPVWLAVGVNVQDVFKHQALYSRFTVSTATGNPLRLYKSELLATKLFDSTFGVPPENPVVVVPRQPANLLFKIQRKFETKPSKNQLVDRTMYIKLYYNTLESEVQQLLSQSITQALQDASLQSYLKVVIAALTAEIKTLLQPGDLERAIMLGEITTSFLDNIPWNKYFDGLGTEAVNNLSNCLESWHSRVARIPLRPTAAEPSSISIPVEIPSVTIVHTADIRLQNPLPSPISDSNTATITVNQVLPATLYLKWSRILDTENSHGDDLEFSYEVTAPADTWLIAGRRKGHFIIPGVEDGDAHSSTPETEAEIPIVLIPQREGWLPYPTVDIREVQPGDNAGDTTVTHQHSCEIDWRNLGETVRAVSDRATVTVSLDASGLGGGPLVFDSEGRQGVAGARIIV